jgi:hypothetical protein
LLKALHFNLRRSRGRDYFAAMPHVDDVPVGNSGPVAINLSRDLMVRLRPEASRRGISVAQLIRDMLETIASDKLVGAVLDDQVPAD